MSDFIVFLSRVVLAFTVGTMVGGCISARGAESPRFTVENKVTPTAVPRFTVENKAGSAPTDLSQPAPPGWEKVSIDGGPWHLRKIAAPAVAAPGAFRNGDYHAGHQCPVCGRSQYVIAGYNRDGTHNHVCAAGHSWRH